MRHMCHARPAARLDRRVRANGHAEGDSAAGRCRRAARRRDEDEVGPRVEDHRARRRQAIARRRPISSPSTTPAGRRMGRCSTARLRAGAPATFRVSGVIPGFSEGIQLMVPGETRRLWIPESLAYKGQPGKPAGTLVFDVELIEMPNRAPADVKAAPPDAMRTASGLSYIVLKEGVGGRHPRAKQRGDRALHGMDDRRQDVRQLGRARPAGDLSARQRHSRVDRRVAVDGRRPEDALLDSREPRVPGQERRRTGCWCSMWS